MKTREDFVPLPVMSLRDEYGPFDSSEPSHPEVWRRSGSHMAQIPVPQRPSTAPSDFWPDYESLLSYFAWQEFAAAHRRSLGSRVDRPRSTFVAPLLPIIPPPQSSTKPKTTYYSVSEDEVPNRPKINAARDETRCLCTFFVGIRQSSEFNVAKRIIGAQGRNMKAIIKKVPGAKIRVRGQGSGFKDQDTGVESGGPLQINMSAPNEGYRECQELIRELLEKIYVEYEGVSGKKVRIKCYENANNHAPPPFERKEKVTM